MLFLRNLIKKMIDRKILLFYGLAAAIFFVLHVMHTWGILEKKELYAFFYLIAASAISVGGAIWIFILIFFKEKNDEEVFLMPLPLLIAILWLASIFFVNIGVISDFKSDQIEFIRYSFFDIARSLAITLLFFTSVYVIGKKILLFFKPVIANKTEEVLFALALGLGFCGNLFFLLGVLKIGYSWIAYSLVLITIIGGYRDIREIFLWIFGMKMRVPLARRKIWEKIVIIFLFILFLLTFVYSLADLMNAGWDTFHQYLTFPNAYMENHGLVYFKFHPQWGSPQLTEMIFFEGLLLGGVKIPFLMNYFFILMGFWGFAQITKNKEGKIDVWLLAILASVPSLLVFQSGYLKAEGLLFFYSVMVFVVSRKLLSLGGKSKNLWVLLSIFLGLVVSVKYTAIFIIAGVVISLWFSRKIFNFNQKSLFLMAMIIFAVFSPWFFKNVAYYNSPLYPLFAGKDYVAKKLGIDCGGYFLSSCKEDNFLLQQKTLLLHGYRPAGYIPFWSNVFITLKPFLAGYDAGIVSTGPFFIIFLPLIIWVCFHEKNSYMKFLAIFSLAYFLLGIFFFTGQVWYFMPGMVSYLLLVAHVLRGENMFGKAVLFKSMILIWLFFSISIYFFRVNLYDDIKYIRNEKKMEEVFSQKDLYKMGKYVNDNVLTENESGVLIYGFDDTQGYFIKNSYRDFIPDFYGYLFTCLSQNGEAYENMKKLGVTHIIFKKDDFTACIGNNTKLLTCQAVSNFIIFMNKYCDFIHQEGPFMLYHLR